MKRIFSFCAILLTCIFVLCGCDTILRQDEGAGGVVSIEQHLLEVQTNEFTDENRTDFINDYVSNYTPVVMQEEWENHKVSFEVNFDVASCRTILISRVDDNDISVELNGFIDSLLLGEVDGKRVTLDIGWWYDGDWSQTFPVWSYLIRLTDTEGNEHHYYFRVEYSKLDENSISEESTIPEESVVPEESTVPDENSEVLQELPPLSDDEVECIEKVDGDYFVYGVIAGKLTNALLLEVVAPSSKETWGEFVYVITDQADEWCVGDSIRANALIVHYPKDPAKYARVTAKEIHPMAIDAPEKPIIYLYPQAPTVCSVKLTLNGALTCTYPDYGKGWDNFTAYPDGTLIFPDGKEYYALYWEGVQYGDWDLSKGFCVRGEDTASFLEWALASQGLTPREANEFIVYWLPRMQENTYNVISFQTDTYTNGAVLDISPAPDSLLRVFMTYYASDTYVDIPPQSFIPFTRQSFAVVEWGGSEIEKP